MARSIYIRFDWAMKRLLRDKANHEVLEGFITSLIGRKFTIVKFLESESNAQGTCPPMPPRRLTHQRGICLLFPPYGQSRLRP